MSNNQSIKTAEKLPVIIHVFYFLLAVTFCFLYYQKVVTQADFNAGNSISQVLTFSTYKPYQFRLLFPLIIKVVSLFGVFSIKAVYLILNCIVVYFILITYRLVLSEYLSGSLTVILLTPMILYPMVWNYILLNQSLQYYDFVSILVYLLGTYFILRDRFLLLLITFTFGLFNKETTAYLVFAYLFYNYKNMFAKKIFLRILLLAGIFIVIKGFLYFIFINNPGGFVEICLGGNKIIVSSLLSNRIYARSIILNFGGLYIFTILLFITGRWKIFISQNSKEKLYINFVFIPFLLFGIFIIYFSEVRVYSELMPIVTTLFIIYLSTFKKLNIKTPGMGNED